MSYTKHLIEEKVSIQSLITSIKQNTLTRAQVENFEFLPQEKADTYLELLTVVLEAPDIISTVKLGAFRTEDLMRVDIFNALLQKIPKETFQEQALQSLRRLALCSGSKKIIESLREYDKNFMPEGSEEYLAFSLELDKLKELLGPYYQGAIDKRYDDNKNICHYIVAGVFSQKEDGTNGAENFLKNNVAFSPIFQQMAILSTQKDNSGKMPIDYMALMPYCKKTVEFIHIFLRDNVNGGAALVSFFKQATLNRDPSAFILLLGSYLHPLDFHDKVNLEYWAIDPAKDNLCKKIQDSYSFSDDLLIEFLCLLDKAGNMRAIRLLANALFDRFDSDADNSSKLLGNFVIIMAQNKCHQVLTFVVKNLLSTESDSIGEILPFIIKKANEIFDEKPDAKNEKTKQLIDYVAEVAMMTLDEEPQQGKELIQLIITNSTDIKIEADIYTALIKKLLIRTSASNTQMKVLMDTLVAQNSQGAPLLKVMLSAGGKYLQVIKAALSLLNSICKKSSLENLTIWKEFNKQYQAALDGLSQDVLTKLPKEMPSKNSYSEMLATMPGNEVASAEVNDAANHNTSSDVFVKPSSSEADETSGKESGHKHEQKTGAFSL